MEEKDPMMEMAAKTVVVAVAFMFMAPTIQRVLAGAVSPVVAQAGQYFQTQAYQGVSDPRNLKAKHVMQELLLPNPWIGATFINDGPDEVMIGINQEDNMFIMPIGETVTITRMGAQERINSIYYCCRQDEVAMVRVIGEY